MTTFGRKHTMSALIVTGNGKGLGGYAVGKAGLKHHIRALVNGMKMASRKLVFVELLEGRTIYQDFYAECRGTRIFAQRRPKGFGVVAHPRLAKICEVITGFLENVFKSEDHRECLWTYTYMYWTFICERFQCLLTDMRSAHSYLKNCTEMFLGSWYQRSWMQSCGIDQKLYCPNACFLYRYADLVNWIFKTVTVKTVTVL